MSHKNILEEFTEVFSSLPGVGPTLAYRLALYLSVNKNEQVKVINSVKELASILKCSKCNNLTIETECEVCKDADREQTLLLVETPLELIKIESTKRFLGRYYVIEKLISPVNGVLPRMIDVDKLKSLIQEHSINELIVGFKQTIEGKSTLEYIKESLSEFDLRYTHLASGIPVGVNIEFVDEETLVNSIAHRVTK